MSNRYISLIAAAMLTASTAFVSAQSKLDIRSGVQINMLKAATAERASVVMSEQEEPSVSVIFTVKDGATTDFGNIPGVKINTRIGNVIVADVKISAVDAVMNRSDVLYGQLSQEETPTMYYARMERNANVNKAHGDPLRELGKAYLGEGVVCGIFDTGFDVNHIDFYDNENRSVTRVKRLVSFQGSGADPAIDTENVDRIKKFTADRTDGHHGGHVLGIMAGSFRGMGEWYDFDYGADSVIHDLEPVNPKNKYKIHDCKTEPVAYYGVAPKADIVLCGTRDGLYEGQQIVSANAVINYAKKVGKPCVINHSFGSQWGPRDGSGSYGDLMDEFAEYAIICKAAGNDGRMDDYISVGLTEEKPSVATILEFRSVGNNTAEVEYWLSDDRPIEVELFFAGSFKIPGSLSRQWVEIPFKTFTPGNGTVDVERDGLTFEKLTPSDLPDVLAGAFRGSINVGIGVAAQNNRYTVDITFTGGYVNNSITYNGSKGALELGVRIKGQPGQRVDGNSPKDYCKFSNVHKSKGADYAGGSPCMSIAEGSCCRKCIAVGSYSARTSINYIQQNTYYTNEPGKEGGNYAPSSGYGVTVDGRRLPHVSAPGVNIISAENRYYKDKEIKDIVARATVDGQDYEFVEMSGTSMACPLFAGICALWLEADPTLKYDDILDVLQHTCRHDKWTDAAPERFGYGKVDAYEGLKYVLSRRGAGVESATVDPDDVMIRDTGGNRFEVTVGGGETFDVSLVSLSGSVVASASGSDTVVLDAGAVARGIYVLTSGNGKFRKSLKVQIK